MVRDVDGPGKLLNRKEVVAQGVPLVMIAYGIGILPIICGFRAAHPQARQPWCADSSGTGGTFDALHEDMQYMLVRGTLK